MLRLVVALAIILPAALVRSAPVVVTFEGVVTDYSFPPSDDFGLLPPITLGDRFTGRYVYDGDVAPLIFPRPSGVEYRYDFSSLPSAGFDVEINGRAYVFTNATPALGPFDISAYYVENPQSGLVFSSYQARFVESIDHAASSTENDVVILFNWEQSDFPDDPLALPSVDIMTSNLFSVFLRYEADPNFGLPIASSRFAGEITSIRVVPEPSTVGLLTAGLCIVLAMRRHPISRGPR